MTRRRWPRPACRTYTTPQENPYYTSHPYRRGSQPEGYFSREEWFDAMLRGQIKPKPPAWWIAAQAKEGRIGATAFSIWHRNYKPERKYVIWDQAPDEDWREHGYLV